MYASWITTPQWKMCALHGDEEHLMIRIRIPNQSSVNSLRAESLDLGLHLVGFILG